MIQEVKISKREQQVLELISREYTSDEIAKEMFISTHTAHTHRKNLLHKLEVRNTAGLVRKAFECRLLHLTCFLLFLTWNQSSILAQEPLIDVEGDSRMRGVMDISNLNDTSSLIVGYRSNLFISDQTFGLNTSIGSLAGEGLTIGQSNSLLGFRAGRSIDVGNNNTMIGTDAGRNNSSGHRNTFVGKATGLFSNGTENTFIGESSGGINTLGNRNTFLGYQSGFNNSGGNDNVYIGDASGFYYSGNRNTYIGSQSGKSETFLADSIIQSIAIGYNSKVACDNCAVIGGTGDDAVNVGIGTISPNSKLHVEGDNGSELLLQDVGNVVNIFLRTKANSFNNWQIKSESHAEFPLMMEDESDAKIIFQYGQDSIFQLKGDGNANLAGMLTENSDSRLKKNIVPITNILTRLMPLSGYTYNWIDPSKSEELQIGLLAQEVEEQFPELVQESENGTLSVSYTRFVPLLIQGLREQEERIQKLERIVQQLVDLQ